MKLINGKKFTAAFYKLKAGCSDSGATVTRRGKGYSDYNVIDGLIRLGLMEIKHTGPRGGKAYHTTVAGCNALVDAVKEMATKDGL